MEQRSIGTQRVGAIGFGAMSLSIRGRPSEGQAIAVICAALDAGITLIDTADAYCLSDEDKGHNERVIARAFREYGGRPDTVLVATKGGHTRPGGRWDLDGRPGYLRTACEASLSRLGVEAIDLYQFHRPDYKVPFEESVGALADLQREGKVRMVGLSNVTLPLLDTAQGIAAISSVQNPFNPFMRVDEGNGLLAACQERGIAYLAYSPLGGGGRARRLNEVAALAAVAERHHASPQQVALAWSLARSPVIIPIPGGRRVEGIRENVEAANLQLGPDDVREIDSAKIPTRWAAMELAQHLAGQSRRVARKLARVALRR